MFLGVLPAKVITNMVIIGTLFLKKMLFKKAVYFIIKTVFSKLTDQGRYTINEVECKLKPV